MKPNSSPGWISTFLAAASSVGLLLFAMLWERRWRQLQQALSQRQEATEEWVERALHDPLTNMPNRTLIRDRLEQALIRAQRNNTAVAVLFIDLDNFKEINDRYGHLVGDRLLIATGERLRQHLRASDTAGRLGGDEFVVLLDIKRPSDPVMMVAERLRRALHVPLLLEPVSITLTASIGVAISDGNGEQPEDLLQQADSALLDAKRGGKNCVVISEASACQEVGSNQAGR